MSIPPKSLRLGTSLSSLKPRFDVLPENKDVTKLCKSAEKLLSVAYSALKSKDEEVAYVFFMKYLNIVSFVHESHEYEKNRVHLDKFLPPGSLRGAIDNAEALSKSLEKRYLKLSEVRLRKQESEGTGKQSEPFPSKISGDVNNKFKPEIPHMKEDPAGDNRIDGQESISSVELLKLLETDSSKVLIMDVRPKADFFESHINFDVCISVPEEIVVRGSSAATLAQKLPEESRLKWARRWDVDYLVLMDWFSSVPNLMQDSKVNCLKEILLKWDPSVTYRSKPIVLNGGYDDFLSHYPMKCTNSKPHIPQQNMDELLSIDDVEYPDLVDEPSSLSKKTSPTLILNNIAQPDTSTDITLTFSQMSFENQKIAPCVDRSSKAAALEKYRDLEKKQAEVAEVSEELGHDRKVAEEKLSQLKKQETQSHSATDKETLHNQIDQLQDHINALERKQQEKDDENNNLRQELERFKHRDRENAARKIPKPNVGHVDQVLKTKIDENNSSKENKSSTKERDGSDDSSTGLPPSDGRGLPKVSGGDVPSTSATFSGLKRSRSSPNIAQLGQDLDSDPKSSTPQFDRTTKPSIKKPHTIDYVSRARNFQEVYGTVSGGLTGLKNLGNSCYMNSILQCVSNTTYLSDYFCSGKYKDDVNRSPTNSTRGLVAEEVAHVVRNLWMGQFRSIACRDLKNVVGQHMSQFRGSQQQDSHEFLTFLLDWLHNDLKINVEKAPAKVSNQISSKPGQDRDAQAEATKAWVDYKKYNDSFILGLFFVQQVSTVSCASCSVKSCTYEEPTSNLTLLLPNASRCSLLDCFRLYTNQERISGYACESCHGSREAEKKIDLCRLPPVLVIHLKRFYSDGFYQKRQTFVDFPLRNLDLREFTIDKGQKFTTYNLYGVSNHYGTLEGGHYTAYCRNGEKWYKFDDQDVSEISSSDVRSPYAYILFYAAV